jgi:hypothetical protein
MSEPSTTAASHEPEITHGAPSVKVAIMEMAATWVVRKGLDSGFRRATGHSAPTARDPDVPYRRIIAWAAVTAAAVAAANIVADRVVLRPRLRNGGTHQPPAGRLEDATAAAAVLDQAREGERDAAPAILRPETRRDN